MEHGPTSLAGAPQPSDSPTAEPRAMAAPLVVVRPAGTFDDRALRVTVTGHTSKAGVDTVTLDVIAVEPTATPAADAPPAVPAAKIAAELDYRVGAPLPFEVGSELWVRTTSRGGGTGLMLWGIRDGEGSPPLLAMVSLANGLAPDAVPGLSVTAGTSSEELAYSEVRMLSSGCTVALDHYVLLARTADAMVSVAPGAMRPIDVGGARWDFVALDASRPSPRWDTPLGCPTGAHTSWALVPRP